jgi:hypothetical protein
MRFRDETAETPRETGARSREAGRCPAWEFRRGCAPFVGILQGGWPPCRSGRSRLQSRARDGRGAYLNQYVDRLNGEPACRQVRRLRACEVERPLYDPGAKKEYRNKF